MTESSSHVPYDCYDSYDCYDCLATRRSVSCPYVCGRWVGSAAAPSFVTRVAPK